MHIFPHHSQKIVHNFIIRTYTDLLRYKLFHKSFFINITNKYNELRQNM